MPLGDIQIALQSITNECLALARIPWVRYVQVFENRGALMGASNPHPHCQIWATASTPNVPMSESRCLLEYFRKRGSCLLCDYLELELKLAQRIVFENDAFAVIVPYWAVWPFETLLLCKRHVSRLDELHTTELESMSDALKRLTTRYDNLFTTPFPYSMGFHQAQIVDRAQPEWHLHAHYYPPLLRSATIQKFMVGFELLGTPQRDLTAEEAAERLHNLKEVHYRDQERG
jgi:UDPglucose--hexose-1-phosphate uridylyltransferase